MTAKISVKKGELNQGLLELSVNIEFMAGAMAGKICSVSLCMWRIMLRKYRSALLERLSGNCHQHDQYGTIKVFAAD